MDVKVMPSTLCGNVTVPPSKSATHRAIIAAALANGKSTISNVDLSSDIQATINACTSLGCGIQVEKRDHFHTLIIDGGLHISDSSSIDCGESGSTLRFFIPIACALSGKKIFSGKGRLPERPIDAYFDIFNREGIEFTKPSEKNLPLTISGTLSGGEYVIDGSVSSQYITGLLFALPLLKADSTITIINNFESKGYVDLTVSILRQFGIDIVCENNIYFIKGNQPYSPQRYTVEGDYSQAAFFLVGGAIAGDICLDGLNENSLQPDSVIVDILRHMGADIVRSQTGLCVHKSTLHGIDIDVSQCPDLVPPLAIAAALATGQTKIMGAARLRIKESDRLKAMSDNLNALGIFAEELADGLVIHGGEIAYGEVNSFNDHRITMAFSVAALGSKNGIFIKGAQCIDKSYPGFFDDLATLGGKSL